MQIFHQGVRWKQSCQGLEFDNLYWIYVFLELTMMRPMLYQYLIKMGFIDILHIDWYSWYWWFRSVESTVYWLHVYRYAGNLRKSWTFHHSPSILGTSVVLLVPVVAVAAVALLALLSLETFLSFSGGTVEGQVRCPTPWNSRLVN